MLATNVRLFRPQRDQGLLYISTPQAISLQNFCLAAELVSQPLGYGLKQDKTKKSKQFIIRAGTLTGLDTALNSQHVYSLMTQN